MIFLLFFKFFAKNWTCWKWVFSTWLRFVFWTIKCGSSSDFFLVSFLIAAVGDDKSSGFFNVTIFFLNTLREWSFSFFINDQKNHTHRSRRRRWWWNFKKGWFTEKQCFFCLVCVCFNHFQKRKKTTTIIYSKNSEHFCVPCLLLVVVAHFVCLFLILIL